MIRALFALLVLPSVARAADSWTWRNPIPRASGIETVCFAKGVFVAAGYSGTILTSKEAGPWTHRVPPDTEGLLSLACSEAGFVAAGYNYGVHKHAAVYFSPDGESWTPLPRDVPDFSDVVYAGGRFLALAYGGGDSCSSADGRKWACAKTGLQGVRLNRLVYGNGVFLADPRQPGILYSSADGRAWTQRSLGAGERVQAFEYGNGVFVALGDSGSVFRSQDGALWTKAPSLAGAQIQRLRFLDGRFLALGDQISLSVDGQSWTSAPQPPRARLLDAAFGAGRFVAAAGASGAPAGPLYGSQDALAWAPLSQGETCTLRAVAYGPGGFAAAGSIGTVLTSPDGAAWTKRLQADPRTNFNALLRGPDAWVAVGTPYAAAWSANGQAWEMIELPQAIRDPHDDWGGLKALAFGAGRYAAVGSGGLIAVSQDGRTWTKAESGTKLSIDGIAYGNGAFAAFARDGAAALLLTSQDGLAWAQKKVPEAGWPDRITFGNGTFVLLNAGASFTSSDGAQWTKRQRPPAAQLKIIGSLDFVNGQFVATGVENRLIFSKDGAEWSRGATTPVFGSIYGVAYGEGSYLAVGENGTILQAKSLAAQASAPSTR